MKILTILLRNAICVSIFFVTHIIPVKASAIVDNELARVSGTSMSKMHTAIDNGYNSIMNVVAGRGLADLSINGKNVLLVDALQVRKFLALGEDSASIKTKLAALAVLTNDEVDTLNSLLNQEFENGGRFDGIFLALSFRDVAYPSLSGPQSFPTAPCDVSDVCEADSALQILADNRQMYDNYLAALQPMLNTVGLDPDIRMNRVVSDKLAKGDFVGLSELVVNYEKRLKDLELTLKKNGIKVPTNKVSTLAPLAKKTKSSKRVIVVKGKKVIVSLKPANKSKLSSKKKVSFKKAPVKKVGKKKR